MSGVGAGGDRRNGADGRAIVRGAGGVGGSQRAEPFWELIACRTRYYSPAVVERELSASIPQERLNPIEHFAQRFVRQVRDPLGLSAPPIQTPHVIREDDAGHLSLSGN